MLKKILLAFLALILSVVLLIGGFVFYNLRDVKLTPEAEAFFAPDPFDPVNNFYAHWAGIYAPEGTEDLYAYGLERVELDLEEDDIDQKALRFKTSDVIWKQFCFRQIDFRTRDNCDQDVALQSLLNEQKILLDRYRDLYRKHDLKMSVGDKLGVPGTYGQDIIALHRLLVLQWIEMAKNGQAIEAINEWFSSMRSMQLKVNSKMSIVEHAVWMVGYGINLNALPLILAEDMGVLEQRGDEIKAILNVDYMEQWNLEEMEKAESNAVGALLSMVDPTDVENNQFFKINDFKNKLYAISQDRIVLAKLPYSELTDDMLKDFEIKHNPCIEIKSFDCWGYNAIGNLVFGGLVKGGELFRNGHIMTARQKALLLWIEARRQNVPVSEIAQFISNVDPSLYNPLNGKPFEWDADKGFIYYHDEETFIEIYYP